MKDMNRAGKILQVLWFVAILNLVFFSLCFGEYFGDIGLARFAYLDY